MRASDLKPLRVPMPGDLVYEAELLENRHRLNDLLAILQEQERVADARHARRPESQLSDEQVDWYLREYARTPDHTVYQMAAEIRDLRRAIRGMR